MMICARRIGGTDVSGGRSRAALGDWRDRAAGVGASSAALEERLTFTAAREIVLQCGRASLVLTRAGKVLVRGAYVPGYARRECSASPARLCRSTDRATMNLLNGTGMAAGHTVALDKAGYEHVVVVVKGTFTLPKPGERPKLAEEQMPLVAADLFTGEPGRSATMVECDYALEKPRCDVLLNGAAYAPAGRPVERIAVGLQVGAWRKSFVVWGNREWRRAGVGYAPSAPEPFERMPISYDNAFGGTDAAMRDPAQHGTYLPNPVGCGWHKHIYPELVVGTPVPNTEEVGDPVRDPGGSIGRWRSDRSVAAGRRGFDTPAPTTRTGSTTCSRSSRRILILGYFQCAPDDQQVPYLGGGEQVLLVNLTPDGRREFALPSAEMPIVFFRRRADRVDTHGALDTLLFKPDAERFSMVWRTSLKLQRDIFEVSHVVVGRMSRAWLRAVETNKSYKSLDTILREKTAVRGDA